MSEPPNLPRARHEPDDVTTRFGVLWFGGIAIALGIVIGIAIALFPGTLSERLIGTLPNFPAPTLQSSPRADTAQFRREQMERLNSIGWIDRDKGVVHIPIADAMHKVVQIGIPGWPTPNEARK